MKNIKKMILVILMVLIPISIPMPAHALTLAGLMKETVSYGKPGFYILVILGLAVASYIAEMICKVLNKEKFAVYIAVIASFIALGLVITVAYKLINEAISVFSF